jgi:DNA-binding transcriptional ArsR family regulator
MNHIRRIFIMAYLVNHGSIKRMDLARAFGMSGRNATYDLTEFQRLHGKLNRQKGRSHIYKLPKGYDTTIDFTLIDTVLDEILKFRPTLKDGAGI